MTGGRIRSGHPVFVRQVLRLWLAHIPQFCDALAFEAEDVHDGDRSAAALELHTRMDTD